MNNTENVPAKTESHTIPTLSQEKMKLLQEIFCKGCNEDEIQIFLYICKHTGLDPFIKQIYPIKRKNRQSDGSYKEVMTVQTGIDGFRLIAERSKKYIPGRESTYKYDNNGRILSATSYVKKRAYDGSWHEVGATAYFNEYCQRTSNGQPTRFWAEMPHVMIAKCAEALALRKAFPAELSGIYTSDEMDQADSNVIDITQKAEQLQKCEEIVQEPNKECCNPTQNTITDYARINEKQMDILLDLQKQVTNKNIDDMWGHLQCQYGLNSKNTMDIPSQAYERCENFLNLCIENNKHKQSAA